MSLLRADKIANRFNNTGPIIVGPSTVSGNFTVTGILTALGIGVTNSINVGQAITTKYLTSTNGTSLFNSSLTGVTTVGIVTGATYYGNGINLTGIVTSIAAGSGIQISPTNGQGRVTISATGVAVAGYSTNAGLTTDVKGGVAGAVLWQVGPNDTGFTAAGNAGEILQSTGTTAPVWTSVTAINVAYADSTGISTNLKGGSAGRIPYQTGTDTTAFLPIGSTGKVLFGQGTLAPIWIDPKASLDVRYSNLSGIATNVIGGVSSVTSLNVTGITTLGGGNVTVENDLNVSGITTSGNLIVTGVGTIGEFYVGVGVAATVGVTTILDEDTMSSDRADALATQQSIKAYVDAQVTAQDLDFNADVGSGAIDLDSEEFTIAGTTNEIYTIGLGNTVTVGLDTNVTIPQDFTVTRNTTLSGLTTITGSLGVTGVTTTQLLDVTGVSTLTTLGVSGVTTTQFLEVTGVTTSQFLNVTGVSTFESNVDINASIDVDGHTELDNLNVSGVSTFASNVDINSGLDVDGHTELDDLNVSGVSTFASNVDINSGLDVDGFTELDSTNISETLNVVGVSTFGSSVNINANLDVDGRTELDTTNISETLNVVGVSTFGSNIDINASIDVDGHTELDDLNVSGVSTFASNVDINASIDVDGHTELDNLNVSGVSTFIGIGTFQSDLYVGGDLYVADDLIFDEFTARNATLTGNLQVSGISTFNGSVDINSSIDVDGHTELDNLRVSGVSTFVGVGTFQNDLYVGGDLYISDDLVFDEFTARNGIITGIGTIETLDTTTGTIDYLTGINVSYSGIGTIETLDTTTGTIDYLTNTNLNVSGIATINQLYITGVSTNVSGVSTFASNVDINADLDVDGFTELDATNISETLNVVGLTTFSSNVDINADLDVDGRTELDITNISETLSVSGVSTFASNVDINASIDIQNNLNVSGVSTFASDLDVNASIDVDGHTELDDLNVSGFSTFSNIKIDNGLYDTNNAIGSNLQVLVSTGIGVSWKDFNEIPAGDAATLDGLDSTQFLRSDVADTKTGITTFSDPTTFNSYLDINSFVDISNNLNVSGVSTFTGFATFGSSVNIANEFYSGGISSVGAAITMYPSTGIVSATAFYGDGSNITGISSTPIVTNILYVTTDGDDINNDGKTIESSKRTVGAALTLATTSTVIKVSAGNYSENNPLVMPEQVSIQGDSLREVSLTPQNINEDFIYVSNGDYIDNVSFTGILNNDKAVIAFNPNKPSYINQGPYIRNCTNFITNSIGMKIDGNHAIGDTKSMSVDSYTQYNQGGIGVSISNEGYAQLVSIFTICTDQSIICLNGGACDLTNSNSSFGRLGLVADGIGPQNFIGTVTTAANVDSSVFTINVGVNTLGITTAIYDNTTGLLTITTNSNHGFNVGKSIEIRDLEFSCSSGPGIVTYPSGNYGYIFTVDSVGAANSFSAYVGVSTLSHDYERNGVISEFISRPYDGQVVYFDELYQSISGVAITEGGSGYGNSPPTVTFSAPSEPWGIRATGVANLTNGSVTSVDMVSNGRGYTSSPTVTFSAPPSGTTALGTATTLPTYYVVSSATPIVNGITTVTFTENVPYAVGVGTSVPFFKQSRVLASSHAFEYIGSGNTISQALPQRGGVGIQANEIVNRNGGLVVYTSTDQAGNFRIGDGVVINQLDGSVSGDAYSRSLFANITPYILALGGGD